MGGGERKKTSGSACLKNIQKSNLKNCDIKIKNSTMSNKINFLIRKLKVFERFFKLNLIAKKKFKFKFIINA